MSNFGITDSGVVPADDLRVYLKTYLNHEASIKSVEVISEMPPIKYNASIVVW